MRRCPFPIAREPEEQRDKKFLELTDSGQHRAAIFNWMCEGLRRYQAQGRLITPPDVAKASQEYRDEQNELRDWVDDECVLNPNAMGFTSRLHESYEQWCRTHRRIPVKARRFGACLRKLGCAPVSDGVQRRWQGIAVVDKTSEAERTSEAEQAADDDRLRAMLDSPGIGDVAKERLKAHLDGKTPIVVDPTGTPHDPVVTAKNADLEGLDEKERQAIADNPRTIEAWVKGLGSELSQVDEEQARTLLRRLTALALEDKLTEEQRKKLSAFRMYWREKIERAQKAEERRAFAEQLHREMSREKGI
jgi:hypothetical protein